MSATPARVERSPELDGLADMVADLFSDNLANEPARGALLRGRPWRVEVIVVDAESQFVISITPGGVAITPADGAKSSLRVSTDGETLIDLPEVPLLLGLPDPRRAGGRTIISKLLRRKLRIGGLLLHPLRLTRLLRLLNTAT
jgi:hypothetical protein